MLDIVKISSSDEHADVRCAAFRRLSSLAEMIPEESDQILNLLSRGRKDKSPQVRRVVHDQESSLAQVFPDKSKTLVNLG